MAVMAAICSKNGKCFYVMKKNAYFDQSDFVEFIQQLILKHKKKNRVCIFLDNASIHKGKVAQNYLSRHKNMKVIYNVPY